MLDRHLTPTSRGDAQAGRCACIWGIAALLLLVSACTAFGVYHTIQPGETLYSLSRRYQVPVDDLASANDIIDPTRLQVGDQIFVPFADEIKTKDDPAQKKKKHTAVATAKKKGSHKKKQSGGGSSTWRGKPPGSPDFIWPVKGVVTSPFGKRWGRVHKGIDIAGPTGTPIAAAASGKVVFSASGQRGYGNLIIVDHGDYLTVYAHCHKRKVSEGEMVQRGQVIATVGKTGRATGPHLHFEIRYRKKPMNPIKYLPRRR